MLLCELLVDTIQQENHTRTKPSANPCGRYLTSDVEKVNNDPSVQLVSAGFSKGFTKDLKNKKKERVQGCVLFLWTFTAPVGI